MSDGLLSTAQPRADQDRRANAREQADARPAPSATETIGAGINTAFDTIEVTQERRLDRAYDPVVHALEERGVDKGALRSWRFWLPQLPGVENRVWDDDAIWREVEKQRSADPSAFKEIGTREQFERNTLTRHGNRARDLETMARGSGLAGFAGGMVGAFADPVNIATLPIGGFGKTVAVRVITEGLAQGAVTAAQTPQIASAHAAMGEEYSIRDAAFEIGTAAIGGSAIRGGIEVAPKIDAAAYRALAPLRERIPGGTVSERDLARAFSRSVPGELHTPEQSAALHVITRAEEIDAASPFRATHAGLDEHASKLHDAMEALETAGERPPALAATLTRAAPVSRASGAPAGGSAGFDMDRYIARNRGAESSGNDLAAAESSSAYGRHQFLKSTWLEFYRKTYGSTGESEAAILRKRADGNAQDRVMRTFTEANRQALKRAGVPVTDGTVYLAHFLGVSDAIKVLRAAPDASLRGLVDGASIAANGPVFKNIGSASELVGWAQRKMGGSGADLPARTAEIDDASAVEASLGAEEVDIAARRGAALEQPDEPDLAAIASDDAPPDIPALDPETLTAGLVDVLRPIVRETGGRSLNRTEELAAELGVGEADLRLALDRMVNRGEIGVTRSGNYRRKAVAGASADDMVRFVAANGGLSYDGLSALGREKGTSLGHDLRNTGNLNRFVPGIGPMLRRAGRGLDEMGERLHEAGFFGPPETTPRPTERELIDTLDELTRTGRKRYAGGGDSDAPAAPEQTRRKGDLFQSEEHYDAARAEYNEAARGLLGRELDDQEFLEAFARPDGLPLPDREEHIERLQAQIVEMANRRLDDALDDAFLEVEDDFYELQARDLDEANAAAGEGQAGGGGREGSKADAGDQGEGGGGGQAGPRAGEQAQLDGPQFGAARDAAEAEGALPDIPESKADAARFDADDGDGVRAIAASDWHDIRQMEGSQDDSIGPFGPVFEDVDPADWSAVRARLASAKTGEVRGALFHAELGAIDLPWGKAGTGRNDGFGLAKLERFHPEVVDDLPRLIAEMTIVERKDGYVQLESADHRGAVRLDWDGRAKTWLLTAFRKGEETPPATKVSRAAGKAQDGHFPALEADADLARALATDKPAGPTFDLEDGKGPRSAAEIDAELAADKASLEAMRSCLK